PGRNVPVADERVFVQAKRLGKRCTQARSTGRGARDGSAGETQPARIFAGRDTVTRNRVLGSLLLSRAGVDFLVLVSPYDDFARRPGSRGNGGRTGLP